VITHYPLVSICIPAYNCADHILETLECLCRQTYSYLQIIIANDGSSDNTLALLKSFEDDRIQIINVTNGGAARARNMALSEAKGDYIIFFDADDFVQPDFIESQLNKIQQNPDTVVLAAWGRFYNDISTFELSATPEKDITFEEWIKFYWYSCTPMTNPGRAIIPAGIIKKAGHWNETLSLNDDLEFFTRVFLITDKIAFNKEAVFYYRSGIRGLSTATGHSAYASLYNSLLLSVDQVLARYNHDNLLLKSCANMWQSFIYTVYPEQKEYIKLAQKQINKLTRPDYKFQAGGLTRLLTSLFGWKIAKRIKFSLRVS
jgi:glycosyltransferase involved in cell wall biosynthesis